AYRLNEEHVPEPEVHERVVEALRFVELEQAIDKFPSELSGGMRRRVSIARAIISNPDLILYDSPTGGLDPITSTTIIELIVKQRDVSQTTSLLITHRIQDAYTLATHRYNTAKNEMELIPNGGIDPSTKFLVLNDGRIVFDGTTKELTHTTDDWLKAFISWGMPSSSAAHRQRPVKQIHRQPEHRPRQLRVIPHALIAQKRMRPIHLVPVQLHARFV